MTQERPIRDFIYSIMDKGEAWANAHLVLVDEEIKKDSLFNFISKFRNHTTLLVADTVAFDWPLGSYQGT